METTTDFLENEKEKIFQIDKENTELLENLKKFIDFLNSVENATNENIVIQLNELNELKIMSNDIEYLKKLIKTTFKKIRSLSYKVRSYCPLIKKNNSNKPTGYPQTYDIKKLQHNILMLNNNK